MITDVTSSSLSTPLSSGVAPGGAMGKNEFLKLFIAQMRNQDPMSPMQGDQFASQLAQFSSLEQLNNISTQLDTQSKSSASIVSMLGMSNAATLIGRTVTATGNGVMIAGGGGLINADVGGSGTGTLHIMDSSGREVASSDLGHLNPGRNTIDLGGAGTGLPDGAYTYRLDVTDAKGSPVAVTQYTTARIDGLRVDASGPVLLANGLSIPFSSIIQVISSS